jgi:tetratricopeptide (TPR) repeat protein
MLSEEDYWRLPQYEEACKAFERSVELYSASIGLDLLQEDICPFEMLTASYVRKGRPGDAVDTLRRALALISDNPSNGASRDLLLQIITGNLDSDASLALSEVYEKVGEFNAAIECIVKPADLLIGYERYAEATALVQRASVIAGEHHLEESQKIAEIRRRLEAAVGHRSA